MGLRRLLVCLGVALLVAAPSMAMAVEPTIESVGEAIFFDTNLSTPPGQSCASCHDPAAGYADPNGDAVSPGASPARYGNRNAPMAAYASFIPALSYDATIGAYVGGQFWDGRAATLEEQAKGPFLNPLEMNMPTKQAVVSRIADSAYADDFRAVFGAQSLSPKDVDAAYDRVASAIAAYERTTELNQFSSKHDYAMMLTGPARMMTFTMQERLGMALFNGKARCWVCHVTPMGDMGDQMMDDGGMGPGPGGGTGGGMGPGPGPGGGGMGPGPGGGTGGGMGPGPGPGGGMGEIPNQIILFSDYRYANLGIPANPENPYYALPRRLNPEGGMWVDHGLAAVMPGGIAANPELDGLFKTPSLRNVALTAPYGHNGYFKTLKEIVHYYNTRDVPGAGWPLPEVVANLDVTDMGNLGLTEAEENAIVAFLGTLSDGWWTPPVP